MLHPSNRALAVPERPATARVQADLRPWAKVSAAIRRRKRLFIVGSATDLATARVRVQMRRGDGTSIDDRCQERHI